MKKLVGLTVLFSLILPLFLVACSMEKDDDDWVDELRDRRTRDSAMLYVQEHKIKKAVPVLLSLIKKRYGTLKSIYTLGIIGDPVAVPALLEELKEVAKKDSMDHDRMTEQICMSLGMIGSSSAVDSLIWALQNAGEMGRAGAVQALGMISDPRGTEPLIKIVKDEKEKLLIRHYATIALGRLKAKEATDALVYALFVDDETGRNLFRDGQLSLLQIDGEEAYNSLIKGYELKFEDILKLAEKIEMKKEWIPIKIVNVMGQMRDPRYADFLMQEFGKGVKNEIVYELQAKVMQALTITPLSKENLSKLADFFLTRPPATEFLNEREIISRTFINQQYADRVDDFMKVAEAGDITLKNAQAQFTKFSQWCFAAANVASLVGDHTLADRFDEFVKSGKCDAEIFGMKKKTKEMLEEFNWRMKASKECGTDYACWERKLSSDKWAEREKAIYVLAKSGDKKFMDSIFKTMNYPNAEVRTATEAAVWALAGPEHMPRLLRFWTDQKIAKEYQKSTENIGYIVHLKMREWNLDNPQKRKELYLAAEKLVVKKKTSPDPPPAE